jgi:cation diffusion facilitator CzcD-associated flavoprotein CzcO
MSRATPGPDDGISPDTDYDATVVGAGFAGLYSLHRLREMGMSVKVLERAGDVGGTWYHNRYPGARCDTESHVYCFSFCDDILEEWEYSERYPEQSEILEYFRYVADRLDLRKDIRFETEVETAAFDDDEGIWEVSTDNGESISTQHIILAVGPLSEPYVPDFDGLETYEGNLYHTAKWPHDPVDFDGERVAIIGTGSSGIQSIPRVAERAEDLTVYQRTPNYVIPARNRPLTDEDWEHFRENYDEIWKTARNTNSGHPFEYNYQTKEGLSDEEVQDVLEEQWDEGGFRFFLTFGDLLSNEETNEAVSEFIRSNMRERIDDPELEEKLVPHDHPYGTKRPPLDYEGYLEVYARDDVVLVDVGESPIQRFTEDGIRTSDGHRPHDSVVLATGFDAVTGSFTGIDILGNGGTRLEDKWDERPRSYLGIGVDDFPNMFMVSGPQSPSAITNQPVSIEQQVEWITDCIGYLDETDLHYIEPRAESVSEWAQHTNEVADRTLYTEAESWYKGSNIPNKPDVFLPYPGGFDHYRDRCVEIADNEYEGFHLASSVEELSNK